ncbi:MAG TPA: hypothetical protein VMV71_03465 [Candidatus Paceibacterota bacterium]|nr:hypothetical protein [Candidatus Paceibacterota bacterium]
MNKLNGHKTGLAFGGFFAIAHTVWALMVYAGMAKPFMDWIFGLHFLNFQYGINAFSFGNALMLVVVTAIIGYIVGYVFAWVWNLAHGASHSRY